MKKPFKTIEQLKKTKYILATLGETVSYKNIKNIFIQYGIIDMYFYYFVYAGCLKKTSRGNYIKTEKFESMAIEEVVSKSRSFLVETQKNKQIDMFNQKRVVNINTKNRMKNNIGAIDIELCIRVLKEKGYRIMKPIQQYEEI